MEEPKQQPKLTPERVYHAISDALNKQERESRGRIEFRPVRAETIERGVHLLHHINGRFDMDVLAYDVWDILQNGAEGRNRVIPFHPMKDV
jgi:hypothetical protein